MRLRIERKDPSPKGRALLPCNYRYWLDDLEISNSLQRLVLALADGDANRLALTLLVDDITIDADVLTELLAVQPEDVPMDTAESVQADAESD